MPVKYRRLPANVSGVTFPARSPQALFARTFFVFFILPVDSYDDNSSSSINSIRLLFLYTVLHSDRPDDNNCRRCYFAYALWKRASGGRCARTTHNGIDCATINMRRRDRPFNAPQIAARRPNFSGS